MQSFNPYSQQVLADFPNLNTQQVQQKIDKAQNTFLHWRSTSIAERSKLLMTCAMLLLDNKEKYSRIISLEMGKVLKESIAEVEKCALCCKYFSENSENFLRKDIMDRMDGISSISYEPFGAILSIMPWNFPFWQVFRFAAPTVMAGNVILLKHAPNVPQSAQALEGLFVQAGFPEGVFQNLFIEVDQVEQVIASPVIKGITFTGSEKAGSSVAQLAAKYIKKSVLELGGSDPFIVLEDTDLELTVQKAVKARMINCGQSCIASKRFIIQDAIYQPFVEQMGEEMKKLKYGDPLDMNNDYSVLARADLADNLQKQVEDSVKLGAKILLGGNQKGRGQAEFFEPTILANVPGQSPAYSQELFGPVAAVFSFKSIEEAIFLANDTRFGLGASIWTKDTEKANNIAKALECGSVCINEILRSDPSLPFGGIKNSGYGRELSIFGLREFVNIKTTMIKK